MRKPIYHAYYLKRIPDDIKDFVISKAPELYLTEGEKEYLGKLYYYTHLEDFNYKTLQEMAEETGCSLSEMLEIYVKACRVKNFGIDNHISIESIRENESQSTSIILHSYIILMDAELYRLSREAKRKIEEAFIPYSEREDFWR